MIIQAPWGEVTHIQNMKDIGFRADFSGRRGNFGGLTVDSLILSGPDRDGFKYHKDTFGNYQDIPITITSISGRVMNYYMVVKSSRWTNKSVTAEIQPRKGLDHFFREADFLSFEVVRTRGFLPDSYFVKVPYLIQKDDTMLQQIILVTTAYTLTSQIIQTVKDIGNLAAAALDVVGTGVLTAVAQGVVLLAYLASLIVAITKVATELKSLYYPKLRYLNACSDYNLIAQGCAAIGYKLESTLLLSRQKEHTLPKPLRKDNPSIFNNLSDELTSIFNKGYPTAQDTNKTLGLAIRDVEERLNAYVRVYDGIVKIETREYFEKNASLVIEDTYNDQEERDTAYTYNHEEQAKRIYVNYAVDYSDKHTSNNFTSTDTEYSTEPINTENADLFNMAKLRGPDIGFSLAARKKDLTLIEKAVRSVFSIVDAATSLFGGGTSFASNVNDRVGVMLISEQNFAFTKKMWLNSDGKQPENFSEFMSADYIYQTYHRNLEAINNTRKIIEEMPTPMKDVDFFGLFQNNFVTLKSTGETVELTTVDFREKEYSADVSMKVKDNGGFNTQTIKIA